MARLVVWLVLVAALMLVEAARAARNEAAQRARGGIEPPDDVYRLMQVAYPAVFLLMIGEGALLEPPPLPAVLGGAAVFAVGKAIKWWAILTLGTRWTFRVIVVPGMTLASGGPYRLMRHPNYVGVIGELVGTALLAGAPVTGVLGTAFFSWLMVQRVRVEERALDAILRRP